MLSGYRWTELNDEMETIWKEAVVAKFEGTVRSLPGETDRNHELQSGQLVSQPTAKGGISQTEVTSHAVWVNLLREKHAERNKLCQKERNTEKLRQNENVHRKITN
jgi:hypothetical protein